MNPVVPDAPRVYLQAMDSPSTTPRLPMPEEIMRQVRTRRLIAGIIALGTGAVLVTAAVLRPAGEGVGTHEQLGLPGCSWITLLGIPCPTCGMTTSFAHAANGNLLDAVVTQPFGALLAIITAMAFLVSIYIVMTGSTIGGIVLQRLSGRFWVIMGGLLLLAWVYKIMTFEGILS